MTLQQIQLQFSLESPTIITSQETLTSHNTCLTYIPGSTLFGAIIHQKLAQEFDYYAPSGSAAASSFTSASFLNRVYSNGVLGASNASLAKEGPMDPQVASFTSKYNAWVDSGASPFEGLSVSDFTFVSKSRASPDSILAPVSSPLMTIMQCRTTSNHIQDSALYQIRKGLHYSLVQNFQINSKISADPLANASLFAPMHCDSCFQPVKKAPKAVSLRNDRLLSINPQISTETGIGISTKLHSTLPSMFYTFESLNPGQVFGGMILVDDDHFSPSEIVDMFASPNSLDSDHSGAIRIGAKKNAGYGQVSLTLSEITPFEQVKLSLIEEFRKNSALLYNEYTTHFQDPFEFSSIIIPFYLHSHLPQNSVSILYQKILTAISKDLDPNQTLSDITKYVKLKWVVQRSTYHSLYNAVIGQWDSFPVIQRGSVGYIQMDLSSLQENQFSNNNLPAELLSTLAEIQLRSLPPYGHKGLGDVRFLPSIFFHKDSTTTPSK